jgi:protein TonB
MKRKNNEAPGFDEIIFENRNKEYGAYDLRKRYPAATFWSITGGVALFVSVTIGLSLSMERDATGGTEPYAGYIVEFDTIQTEIYRQPEIPEIPKPEITVNAYIPPVVVEKLDSGDVTLASVVSLDSVKNKPVDLVIDPVADPVVIIKKDPEPVFIVEEMPAFPGGEKSLMKFIYDNIEYPAEAAENNIEGRVILKFVVGTDGSVTRIEIIKGIHPVLDQEAVRVVSLLPKWKPGRQNGEQVPVWFTVPVNFKLKRN